MSGLPNGLGGYAEFEETESAVRYYCRQMPSIFVKAANARVWDERGREYTDFLAGCGSLNFGHNHPAIKAQVLRYLSEDGIVNALDLHTDAKRQFIRSLRINILEPRGLSYRVQFAGPTGTNAVEAAIKLARKVTGRQGVVAFTNAFHGMTLGSLAVSGNRRSRAAAGVALTDVVRLPYDSYEGAGTADLDRFVAMVDDPSGGVEPPAAFIVETVQGEGGLRVASKAWLRHLAKCARRLGAVLIVDDIQAGCGRTGTFFSFDQAGIRPDIVCLAKSVSGIGLPMSVVLIRPDLDQWRPGEHNGTFRGNNLAFVAAAAALDVWLAPAFQENLRGLSDHIRRWLGGMVEILGPGVAEPRGVGPMSGLAFADARVAGLVAQEAFRQRVLVETSGPRDEVIKLMPPLTIQAELLKDGLRRLEVAIQTVTSAAREDRRPTAA